MHWYYKISRDIESCERHPVGATTMCVGEVCYLYMAWFGLVFKYSVEICKDGVCCGRCFGDRRSVDRLSRLARTRRARIQKGNLLLEGTSFFGAHRHGEGGKEPFLFALNVGLVEATDAIPDGGEVKGVGAEFVATIFGGLDDGGGEVVVELLLSGRVVAT